MTNYLLTESRNTPLGVAIVSFPQHRDPVKVGIRDVPLGKNFWVVTDADIPEDREDSEAWELNLTELGTPDGVGTYVPGQPLTKWEE